MSRPPIRRLALLPACGPAVDRRADPPTPEQLRAQTEEWILRMIRDYLQQQDLRESIAFGCAIGRLVIELARFPTGEARGAAVDAAEQLLTQRRQLGVVPAPKVAAPASHLRLVRPGDAS